MRTPLLTAVAAVFAAAPVFAQDVVINELRVSEPGADDNEFFELAGAAGTSLDGLTFVVLQDNGNIDGATDLTGQTIPASGFFVAAEPTFTLGAFDLTANLAFENNENTQYLLVDGFTGSVGSDLDVDDDGVLESTPWGTVLDQVALASDLAGGDLIYVDPIVGPDGSFFPGGVYREDDSAGPLVHWTIHTFDVSGDTPGAPNPTNGRLPASFGGGSGLGLDFGAGAAGEVYLVAASLSGTTPGITIGGQNIPLNLDAFLSLSLQQANSGAFVNTLGTLDANGTASAQLVIPSGLTGLAGVTLDAAAITVDPFTGTLTAVSNGASIVFE